jgi:hypothetical protein
MDRKFVFQFTEALLQICAAVERFGVNVTAAVFIREHVRPSRVNFNLQVALVLGEKVDHDGYPRQMTYVGCEC